MVCSGVLAAFYEGFQGVGEADGHLELVMKGYHVLYLGSHESSHQLVPWHPGDASPAWHKVCIS